MNDYDALKRFIEGLEDTYKISGLCTPSWLTEPFNKNIDEGWVDTIEFINNLPE